MEPSTEPRFWLEQSGRPPHITIRCCCGWTRTATTDSKSDRLAEEHTRAHEALVDAGVA